MILKTKCIVCQGIIRNFTFRDMNSKYGVGHLIGNLFHSFKFSVHLPDGILTQIALSYFVTSAVIQHYQTQQECFPQLFKIANGFAANLWL